MVGVEQHEAREGRLPEFLRGDAAVEVGVGSRNRFGDVEQGKARRAFRTRRPSSGETVAAATMTAAASAAFATASAATTVTATAATMTATAAAMSATPALIAVTALIA
jgi:hypothetical protein